ncbi:MAG: IPT/TIG domain-containing protein [Actinomycetota bacterium]
MSPRRTMKLAALVPALLVVVALLAPAATAAQPQPSITGFSPTSGAVGATVQISGNEFQGVNSVTFNGTAASFVANSHTLITATVPSGATTGRIRVARSGASSTSATDFVVTSPGAAISGFSPASGHVGDAVQISGTNLMGVDGVTFHGVAATSFVVDSDTRITAVVPAGATTGPIAVHLGGATSTSASDFTVIPTDPDLTLAVADSTDPVVADSTLTYSLTVHNVGGSSADNTSLVDTLPPQVIFQSASGGGTYDNSAGTVTWSLGTAGAGATLTETIAIQPIHPEFPMTNSASVTTTSIDPGSPNTVTTDTEVDPQPGTHYVSVSDAGATPPYRGLALGETIQWDFFGPSAHEITDSHGLGYLDTGLHSPVSYSSFTFDLSAELRTKDLDAFPLNVGKITVPPNVAPSTGLTSTSFLVVWALQQPPTNIVEDVQLKRPGAGWVHWRHRQSTRLQDQFVPDSGPGTYAFRSRIRNVSNGAKSRFGPPVTITVS